MSTPAELLAQSLAKLQEANRIDGSRNSYRKDNPAEYTVVMAYLKGGTRPTSVTSDMGVGLMLEEDARRALLAVPIPPDPVPPDPVPPDPVPPAGPTPPPTPGAWTLTFNDDFDTLDLANRWVTKWWWNGDTYWPDGEVEINRAAQLSVANSILTIKAERATPPITNWNGNTNNSNGEPYSWWSALMTTGGIKGVRAPSFFQQYGYWEARIQMPPTGAGIWPAFWLLGVTPNGVNSAYNVGSEMDILEIIGTQPNVLQMNLHNPNNGYRYNSPVPLLGGGFHTYGFDWEPGHIAWYFDNVEVARYTGTAFDGNAAHYIILNLALGGANSWPGATNAQTPSPMTMLVDFVRVWKH